ncbi:Chitin binding Peritrophin-A domain [Sphingobacterium spiritivorum]|uniref:Chitin binding Peritrophin-A domain n=1 Tax=Sphingobacterium spiritivorum TaxID=258 RepID=A0A380C9Y9_SPHSI|nr:chitin binding peritrophin-A domain-containing protein [Sphingobacterium spiritivorum]SUJ14651.1 Chitin binding Peritrophin-A domain [Sphingobacterium spiritivorum]
MKATIMMLTLILMNLCYLNPAKAQGGWAIDINLDICREAEIDDGLYPNFSDCRWFYTCYKGNAIARQCPEGLIWDVRTNTCSWPFSSFNVALNCPYPRAGDL